MGDWGFKISEEGEDVLTVGDKNTIINSKVANLKGTISGGGTTTLASGVLTTITVAHGLSFIPFAEAFAEYQIVGEHIMLPFDEVTLGASFNFYFYCDATNLYIKLFQGNIGGSPLTIDYKYFIFKDKGKI